MAPIDAAVLHARGLMINDSLGDLFLVLIFIASPACFVVGMSSYLLFHIRAVSRALCGTNSTNQTNRPYPFRPARTASSYFKTAGWWGFWAMPVAWVIGTAGIGVSIVLTISLCFIDLVRVFIPRERRFAIIDSVSARVPWLSGCARFFCMRKKTEKRPQPPQPGPIVHTAPVTWTAPMVYAAPPDTGNLGRPLPVYIPPVLRRPSTDDDDDTENSLVDPDAPPVAPSSAKTETTDIARATANAGQAEQAGATIGKGSVLHDVTK